MNDYLLFLLLSGFSVVIAIFYIYFYLFKKLNLISRKKDKVSKSENQINILQNNNKGWLNIEEKLENAVVQIFSVSSIFNWIQPFKSPVQVTISASGFFINEQGYFITNSHVVEQAKSVWIHIPLLGRKNLDAEIISICPDRDLALLKLKEEGVQEIKLLLNKIPFLELGDSDKVSRTDKVLTMGYPLGQHYLKVTTGIVSGKEHIEEQLFIQIDAAINPGSSGGPVLNEEGKVIGITTVMVPMAQNVGYIIPINELKNILDELFSVPFLRKPVLGINFSNATNEQVKFLNNPLPGGLYVNKVYKNSLGQKIGIEPGDMIYEINKCKVDVYGDVAVPWSLEKIPFIDYVSRINKGQDVNMITYKNGLKKIFNFKFENSPLYPIRIMYPEYESIDYEIIGGLIIMNLYENHVHTLFPIEPSLIQYEKADNQVEPKLIITYVFPNSEAFRLRILNAGDIIESVNDVKVNTLEEFRKALNKSLSSGYLTIKANDSLLVLDIMNVIKDEYKFSQDYKYPLSTVITNLSMSLEQQKNK